MTSHTDVDENGVAWPAQRVEFAEGGDDTPPIGCHTRALTIVDDPPARSVAPRQGTPLTLCPSNIDYSTQRGKALALKAGSPGDIVMPEDGVLRLICTHYIIVPDSRVDEKTGEIREFAQCCFFDSQGRHYRTSAAHGPYRLKAMCDLYSDSEWQRGIPLVISVRRSKRGTMYHDIQIDLDAL
jgi:hypothetical protein